MPKGVMNKMKFTCSKSDLLNGVSIVSKAVPTKTTMAILECILIDASSDNIKLTANNTELGIETVIEGNVIENGIVALDAKILYEMIRNLPDNDVTITTDQTFKTTIVCEKINYNIIGKSGEDFSYLPNIHKEEAVLMSQYTLKETIRQTIFSVSDNDNNKMMTGELFDLKGDKLRVISMDGYRVSIRNVNLSASYGDKKIIVPGKTLQELLKVISGDMDSEISIFFTKNHIVFEFDRTTVVSRIIEGNYFDIDRMLTDNYETKVRVNKKEILDSFNRTTPLIKENDKKPIVMNLTGNEMELKINSFAGSFDEEIDVSKEGNDIRIGFNPKFFIDALKVIEDEEISINMVNAKSPCFIKDDEGKFIYMVLPVSIVDE